MTLARFEKAAPSLGMAIVIACALATAGAAPSSAATFSARQTHRGLVLERSGGSKGILMPNGLLARSGEPTFVYRETGGTPAGIWQSGPNASVVRSGTSANAPVIGRIVPAWDDDKLRLTIEPADGAPLRTTVFKRDGGQSLDRGASTRIALEGSYRATLTSAGGADAGWLTVDIDPEGATRFTGDLPPAIPPGLLAAAVAAIEGEVDFIYARVDDVGPLCR